MGSHTCLAMSTSANKSTGGMSFTQSKTTQKLHAGYVRAGCLGPLSPSPLPSTAQDFTEQTKMPKFMQPCTVCGALSRLGPLCQTHQQEAKARRNTAKASRTDTARKSQLYNYAYRQEAKRVKAEATFCHICGKAFVEGDKVEADHLIAGLIGGPLGAAHRL